MANSIFQMIKTFAKEAALYAKNGAPNVTQKEYRKRLEACNICPHLKKDLMRCGVCGCLVEHKAKWQTSQCPDEPQRWAKIVVGAKGKKLNIGRESSNTDTSDATQPTDTEG